MTDVQENDGGTDDRSSEEDGGADDEGERHRFSRRKLLIGAAVVGGAAALSGIGYGVDQWVTGSSGSSNGSTGSTWQFVSRPDLQPPVTTVVVPADQVASGYVFLAPSSGIGQYGPMIMDNDAEPIWFRPLSGPWPAGSSQLGIPVATNLAVREYRNKPVLCWWEGKVILPGYGEGHGVLFDDTYTQIATIKAGNGKVADLHELILTPKGTALLTFYETISADLSEANGPRDGKLLNCGFQEVDIASGKVLLEWSANDHIAYDESYTAVGDGGTADKPWDFFHINSIEVEPDGNLLISARHTWALYEIDRTSGEVLWRLNGKQSDFEMDNDAQFSWQHDARRTPSGDITLFDDAGGVFNTREKSRGLMLSVDTANRRVTMAHQYVNPGPILASSQGSTQLLENGNVFVGWGSQPYVSEFAQDGRLLFDAQLGPHGVSYRAYRFPWKGHPTTRPDHAYRSVGGVVHAYASWNGASDVASWKVVSGPDAGHLRTVAHGPRTGFETILTFTPRSNDRVAAVAAVDAKGAVLRTSKPTSLP